jgi:hypothetical protein
MKPALTRLGKRGWRSMRGPSSATGAASASATICTIDIQRPQHIVAFRLAVQAGGVEGHALRFQDGRAHVDRDAAICFQARFDHAGQGFNPDRALVGQTLVGDESHEGAGAVTALLDLAAVGVVNAIAEIDFLRLRLFHHQHLVGADAEAAVGQALPLGRAEIDVLVDGIDDHEVIAGAMHLGEFQFHVRIIL